MLLSKKRLLAAGAFAIILLVLAGGATWLYGKNSAQQAAEESSAMSAAAPQTAGAAPEAQSDFKSNAPGTYQAYGQVALENAGSRERVLFFHAPWCPQCRQLEADIETRGVPAGIAIFKIDYDSRQDLRQRYGVTQQTTVVHIDADGNKISSFLPYSDPTLANALDGLRL